MRYRDNVWLQAFIALVIFVMCIAGCHTFCDNTNEREGGYESKSAERAVRRSV